jgi:signal transduction histidine kinase
VGSAREALAALASRPFDLVLLDQVMPEIDGIQLLKQLRADSSCQHIPVIMVSAQGDLESAVLAIELGAEDYLPKPFNPVLLRARVGACLEKKRLHDAEVHHFAERERNFERLKELERLRDELTQMIVHDLRTPMAAILTSLQLMERLGGLTEKHREVLGRSLRGGRELLGMINDMLDVSKMEAGAVTLNREDLAAGDLLLTAVEQVAPLAEQKQLSLSAAVATDLAPLAGDREKLERTLVNLLSNAVKFTPAGGEVVASVTHDDSGQEICFAVRDTGEGIPSDAFDRIFEKFGQVGLRGSHRKLSTGLGLTFCKMVVDAHGGRIWVESEVGQGSTFSFCLPAG